MPKVKNPLFSQEARGGIGGLVYNTWRGINYVKTNTSPTGQGTELRLAAQAKLSAVAKEWAQLSDAERAGWNQYAIDHPVTDWTGSPKRLTGMNWYCKLSVELHRLGAASVDTAPVVAAPDPVTGFALSMSSDDIQATWTAPTAADYHLEFFIQGPHSTGLTGKLEKAAFLKFLAAETASPVNIKEAVAVGRWTVWVRSVDEDTGLVSTWVSDYVDYTGV